MARIVVFDSGLGSLSIIGPLRRALNLEVVYYADEASFPYGTKTVSELRRIITDSLEGLRKLFSPDLLVMGSNTPSLILPDLLGGRTLGVLPPLRRAAAATGAGRVAILATRAACSGTALGRYVERCNLPGVSFRPVDCGELVGLVERATFLRDAALCRGVISRILAGSLGPGGADVATLSSTHLPFLRELMESEFPGVKFLDPADDVVRNIRDILGDSGGPASLEAYTSGDAEAFSRKLESLGVRCPARHADLRA